MKSGDRTVDLASVFDALPNPCVPLTPDLRLDGPSVTAPDRAGFGSRPIERNIRHDLAGEVELDYASDGFVATFSIPLDREQGT